MKPSPTTAPYGLKASYWLTQLGSNYVDMAFQWAHAADPNAKLFYNDYGGEGLGGKSDGIYNYVKGMVSRGVPINGVGLQMHVTPGNVPSQANISANMARLAALGLEVHVSEMDVQLPVNANGNATAANLAAQATTYQNVFAACQAAPNCTGFLTWGFTDAYSWIPSHLSLALARRSRSMRIINPSRPMPLYPGTCDRTAPCGRRSRPMGL